MTLLQEPHPVFDQLNRVLLEPEYYGIFHSRQSGKDLHTCHGITKQHKRCTRQLSAEKCSALDKAHEALRSELTAEAQREVLERYVQNAHCHLHVDKAMSRLQEKWTPLVPDARDDCQEHKTETDPDSDPEFSSLRDEADPTITSSRPLSPATSQSDESLADAWQAEDIQVKPHIRVAAGLSVLAHASPKDDSDVKEHELNLVSLGVTSAAGLWRRVSVRDKSLLSRELYKPLTRRQHQTVGILYILQHDEEPDLWKVGWTQHSASRRISQSGNCYGNNTTIVHQTQGGKFVGAAKAEKLAHAYLVDRRLQVIRCKMCGRSHQEWFLGPWDEIFSAVRIMEGLMRLPGYEERDGQMKLAPKVHAIFEQGWKSTTTELERLIKGVEALGDSTAPAEGDSSWLSQVSTDSDDVHAMAPPTAAMKDLVIEDIRSSVDKDKRLSIVTVREAEVDGGLRDASHQVRDEIAPGPEKTTAAPQNMGKKFGRKAGVLLGRLMQGVAEVQDGFKEGMEKGSRKEAGETGRERAEAERSPPPMQTRGRTEKLKAAALGFVGRAGKQAD